MTKDYTKGKIYKIVATTNEEHKPYVGSTIQKLLSQRFSSHRHKYKLWKEGKYNKTSSFELFEKFGIDNCQIILIENYPCNSNDELFSRERYWFDKLNVCNKYRPKLSEKEIDNRTREIYQKAKQKDPNHCKTIYSMVSHKVTCDCGKTMTKASLLRHQKSKIHMDLLITKNN
jgi:hypothetical protein